VDIVLGTTANVNMYVCVQHGMNLYFLY